MAVALQLGLLLVNGVLYAAISALGRYHVANAIEAVRQTVELMLAALVIGFFRTQPNLAAWIYPLSAALTCGAAAITVAILAPSLFVGPWRIAGTVLRRLWRPTLASLMLAFWYNGLIIQGPRVILAVASGANAVAGFAIAAMVLRLARVPMEVPGVTVLVELSLTYERGDAVLVRRLLAGVTRTTFWMAVVMLPILIGLGPAIVSVWSNGRVHVDRGLVTILAFSTFVYSFSISAREALQAINRIMSSSMALLVLGGPFIVACWFLSRSFSASGAAIAVTCLETCIAFCVVFSAMRTFGLGLASVPKFLSLPRLADFRAKE